MSSLPHCIFRCSVFRYVTLVSFVFLFKLCYLIVTLLLWWRINTYLLTSSFYKQSMKINNYHKVAEWVDSSIYQSTVIEQLDKKDLHYPIQIEHKTGEGMSISKMDPISFAA